MDNRKVRCLKNLESVIEVTTEMINLLNNGPEDPEDDPLDVFIEAYQDVNESLINAMIDVVKANNS